MSGWDNQRDPAAVGGYRNYLGARPAAPRAFNPWTTAILAYLIGTAVLLTVGFVFGMVGFALATVAGAPDFTDGAGRGDLAAIVFLVGIVPAGISVLVQARFVAGRGGVRPFVATFTAMAVGWLIGLLGDVLTLEFLLHGVLVSVAQVVVLAKLIAPRR